MLTTSKNGRMVKRASEKTLRMLRFNYEMTPIFTVDDSVEPELTYIPLGDYNSIVMAVELVPSGLNGIYTYHKVTYDITSLSGGHYCFVEEYYLGGIGHKMTLRQLSYMRKNGISGWKDYVGCQEVVTLGYKSYQEGGYTIWYYSINKRKFIYEPKEGADNADTASEQ